MIAPFEAITFLINKDPTAKGAVVGVTSARNGSPPVTLQFSKGATPTQIAAANAIASAADISPAGLAAIELQMNQVAASPQFESVRTESVVLRAIVSILIDEINTLRQAIVARDAVVAGASSLTNLKTGWAAVPTLPNRTLSQAKTAIEDKISSGAAN